MKVQAILLDTRSIQSYIFSGNKLKTNIGASYIVEHLFEEVLVKDVLETLGGKVDAASWKEGNSPAKGLRNADYYLAYIGGGKALVLLKDKDEQTCRNIVAAFTKKLLVKYPGLRTASAIGEFEEESLRKFKDEENKLFATLKVNQNNVFPLVNVPVTGLTQVCEVNGEAANYYDTKSQVSASDRYRFYSQEVAVKAQKAEEANKALHELFVDVVGDYKFPSELSKLGQREGENDIAIIHVDGNQMGKMFSECETLADRSVLSYKVKNKTISSFARLLETIITEKERYKDYLDLEDKFLPIRPLILGGDDVTFVCPARVAVQYAQRFMRFMDDEADALAIKSCAGIAILPAAYPFIRGYELAEQLCDSAKQKSRKNNSCWLDFAILHGEQAPELEQIRAQEYSGALGKMHFGPYKVDVADPDNEPYALDNLLMCTQVFNKMSHGKVKMMRGILQHGEHEIAHFMEQFKHAGGKMPDIAAWRVYRENLWHGVAGAAMQTPYVDAIELMDYVIYDKEA